MRTIRNRKRTAALGTAVTAVLALALTACGGDDGGTKSAGPADNSASAEATVAAKDTAKGTNKDDAQGGTASDGAKAGGSTDTVSSSSGKSTGGAAKTGGSTSAATGGNTSDAYAYKHPCKSSDLSVRVYAREGSATQHVIEVNNTGKNSCGLSYFPRVSLGASNATDHSGDITPLVPGGLGGAPAYPVKPKTAAIAVIDLNPGGGNGVTWVNELNVLADGDHMPNADQLNFPLGPDVKVGTPKLGLYERSIADAVASMKQANTKP
ncbi:MULTISPECIES: DUF4232 domain-containing protein [unclassified Streptomyces]|uniref:DUF4232 domain-containing protein n=1 Tax=unclassified Streptomyces TaxID=2593676 RepID=UPI002ED61E5B|nr:DUF4232 domain-containing protein [Streptomyces sp. NBC_00891]WSY06771.1 DUF4232 domain-containing protein [Streptomyces sp. NBC_00890]WSZ08396.1 DUF4232 domain-containing protein [Streptomyces sp. NBC_00869]WSZ24106.1 DUF4232 domain-containing protein [Streptomyces sp. NBC_00870]